MTLQIVAHFFAMDGYAAYIWPAYGVAAFGLIGITVTSLLGLRRRQREAAALGEEE